MELFRGKKASRQFGKMLLNHSDLEYVEKPRKVQVKRVFKE